jgi:SAM-dependent methyltransferase
VLDVAAGTGNTAIAAARRYAEVTATDFVPALLDRAAARASSEGVRLHTEPVDAQRLPFADGRFDVVTSSFGAMFAPDQRRTADELARVCRPGGRIALASWSPGGLASEQLEIVADFQGGPDGLPDPTRWGTVDGLRELFGGWLATIEARDRTAEVMYRSPEHCLQGWRRSCGPVATLLASLSPEDQAAFRRELEALWARHNRAVDGSVVVRSTYLQAVITRR